MRIVTLLERAEKDLWQVDLNLQNFDNDDRTLDLIAYHLQQSIEKTLKFMLSERGVTWKKTHRMHEIHSYFVANGIDYPEEFKEYWRYLDDFESDTRYQADIVASMELINQILPLARNLIQQQLEQQQLLQLGGKLVKQGTVQPLNVFRKEDIDESFS